MPETINAHRLFTTEPVACRCHADQPPAVPRFASEALPTRTRRNRRPQGDILDSIPPAPPAPRDVDPVTWLAVVDAAVKSLKNAARDIEHATKRRRQRTRPQSDKIRRTCGVCAAEINGRGFSLREASMVADLSGKVRFTGLSPREAQKRAQSLANREGADMVLLTAPVFVGTRQEATREVLIRPRR